MKKTIYFILSVLGTSLFAIIFHKCLPADANSASANSFLVEKLSFPVVAILYFIILFVLCAIAIYQFGMRSNLSKKDIFLRFGIGYGLIYFVGMFEIIPGADWNMDIAINQIFVGLGDAVPAFLIAFLISRKIEVKSNEQKKSTNKFDYKLMLIVAFYTFIIRIIGYNTNLVINAMDEYCAPVVSWTVFFSIIVGFVVALLYPFFVKESKFSVVRFLLSFGCNWFWFNSFMVLICKNYEVAVCLRVSVDLIAILIGIAISTLIVKMRYTNKIVS